MSSTERWTVLGPAGVTQIVNPRCPPYHKVTVKSCDPRLETEVSNDNRVLVTPTTEVRTEAEVVLEFVPDGILMPAPVQYVWYCTGEVRWLHESGARQNILQQKWNHHVEGEQWRDVPVAYEPARTKES